MSRPYTKTIDRSTSREQQLREAVLLTFCEPARSECARLLRLTYSDWQRLLHWLDTSGLALYFLDRVRELGLSEMLPAEVIARLEQNLADSTLRIEAMIAESTAIQRGFLNAGLSYAVLKGFSLWPDSVPKLALRSQLDLDFLVAQESAVEARKILEDRGYHLHAISGRSWEFKSNEGKTPSLKEMYKAGLSRCVELHLEVGQIGDTRNASSLSCIEQRSLHGLLTPVLSPVDLFLGQGLHLFKHVCSEFARAAHLIEFRRHILARYNDVKFWQMLQEKTSTDSNARMRLGLVIGLIAHVMGDFAPLALTSWTVDCLPAAAVDWVELYGRRSVLATFPGSKLYLLLQSALEGAGLPPKRSLRQSLLPRRLPPLIAHGAAGETFRVRLKRYRRQGHFIFFRLRFHVVEGLHYLLESARWRNLRNGLAL
jgi:hypothetical protein